MSNREFFALKQTPSQQQACRNQSIQQVNIEEKNVVTRSSSRASTSQSSSSLCDNFSQQNNQRQFSRVKACFAYGKEGHLAKKCIYSSTNKNGEKCKVKPDMVSYKPNVIHKSTTVFVSDI
ncbi:hypothetical protein L1987_32508 [Smallanthus sonchifolius]|uniref:Uncharacterized protein n=1 Tax=Smallanthus sonchifolius TaxID=185202 RepID=A0ACB9HPL2_9ASTR|nr:hypothetical protein L1987_32508 [Smallanthus sonchifolius]